MRSSTRFRSGAVTCATRLAAWVVASPSRRVRTLGPSMRRSEKPRPPGSRRARPLMVTAPAISRSKGGTPMRASAGARPARRRCGSGRGRPSPWRRVGRAAELAAHQPENAARRATRTSAAPSSRRRRRSPSRSPATVGVARRASPRSATKEASTRPLATRSMRSPSARASPGSAGATPAACRSTRRRSGRRPRRRRRGFDAERAGDRGQLAPGRRDFASVEAGLHGGGGGGALGGGVEREAADLDLAGAGLWRRRSAASGWRASGPGSAAGRQRRPP